MSAFDEKIVLEIYLDSNDEAQGLLYIDDGVTFKHERENQRLAIVFSFENRILYYKNLIKGGSYADCKILI